MKTDGNKLQKGKQRIKKVLKILSPFLDVEEALSPDADDKHKEEQQPTPIQEGLSPIISGVQGLADYLGCSKGTAMKIGSRPKVCV